MMVDGEQRNWKLDKELTRPRKHKNGSLLSKRLLVEILWDKLVTQCFKIFSLRILAEKLQDMDEINWH